LDGVNVRFVGIGVDPAQAVKQAQLAAELILVKMNFNF
jgi:hypothetical protein